MTEVPICNNGQVQIQIWQSPLQRLRAGQLKKKSATLYQTLLIENANSASAWYFQH